MGTNYYVAKNMCDCCNRYDKDGYAFTSKEFS